MIQSSSTSCKLQFKHSRSCLGNLFTPNRPVCIRRECGNKEVLTERERDVI